jgi:N-acetylglucosamine kinase-like BadF-type ATPase
VKDDIDLVKSIRKRYEEGDPKAVEMVRLLRRMLRRRDYNENLIKELKQMYKKGNPVAIEVIENMKRMINEVENQ